MSSLHTPSDSEVFEKVRRIFADVLNLPPASLGPASSPESIPSWDSVRHLSLTLSVEETFGVQFEPDEMDALTSFGQFVSALENKLKQQT